MVLLAVASPSFEASGHWWAKMRAATVWVESGEPDGLGVEDVLDGEVRGHTRRAATYAAGDAQTNGLCRA